MAETSLAVGQPGVAAGRAERALDPALHGAAGVALAVVAEEARAVAAGVLAELVLFAGGLSWLAVLTHSFAQALRFGLYWFVFAEVIKVMLAAGVSAGWQRVRKEQA